MLALRRHVAFWRAFHFRLFVRYAESNQKRARQSPRSPGISFPCICHLLHLVLGQGTNFGHEDLAHQSFRQIGATSDSGSRILALSAQLGLGLAAHAHHGTTSFARYRSRCFGSGMGRGLGGAESVSIAWTILA